MSLGPWEIILIVLLILLLFGAKRIPEIARSLGRASYEFKKAKKELEKEGTEVVDVAEENARNEDKVEQADKNG